jgi:hypothetical protein
LDSFLGRSFHDKSSHWASAVTPESKEVCDMTGKAPSLRFVLTAAIAALLLAFVPTALAGKGHGGKAHGGTTGSGTISLVLLNSTDGLAHYGQQVTFTISTASTSQPWVHLKCYQNGVLVGEGWNGYFVGSLTGRNFTLASPQWTSGAADCTAALTTPQWTVLASTSFHVYA